MSTDFPVRRRASPPLRLPLLVFLTAAVLTGGACLWAALAVPHGAQAIVAWYGGTLSVLTSAALAVASYGVQEAKRHQANAAALNSDIAKLADETLPAVARKVRDGVAAEPAVAEVISAIDSTQQRLVHTVAQELGTSERMRAAAMATCANAASRMQALATSMLADLREMEQRHDEDVLEDLLKLDHSTAQAGRLADSIAVLTGARSGRRWTKPIVMESILRGAMSRISAYQRIRLHSTSTVAVVGYAAEGIMHVLAELMDNATHFSPPAEEVHVYVEELHSGVVVTIEDSGLVMSLAALDRAERLVSPEPLDLTTLSGTRLGLAVVGQLARKHNLTVSFRSSARGGTGVVVMIPGELITQPWKDRAPAPRTNQVPSAPAAAEAVEPATDNGELPRRSRGRTLTAAMPAVPKAPAANRARPDPGERFGAFRNARRSTSDEGGDRH